MTAALRVSLAALFGAALVGRAHAQPMPVPAPVPPPVPMPVPMPPPVEEPPVEEPPVEEPPADVTGATDPGEDNRPGDAADDGKGKKDKKGKDKAADPAAPAEPPAIEVSGRVFSRFTAYTDDTNDWNGQFSLDSARVQVNYTWKKLSAEVSFEVRGSVRDAYLDLELSDDLTLRAGRFKQPASAIERTSTWTLPTIDRPMVADVLNGGAMVTGRRSGAQLTWRQKTGLHPKVELAIGQAVNFEGDDLPGFFDTKHYGGLMATVRAEIRPVWVDKGADVRVGVFGQNREVNYASNGIGRYWAGGLDVEADLPDVGLRVWADVIAGTAHFGEDDLGDAETPFVASQAVIGWRRGGADRGKRFIEPFVSAAYMNPTTGKKNDVITEYKVGVAGGRWKRWRAQVQFAYRGAQYGFPSDLGGIAVDFDDRTTVQAQLGAAF